MEGRTCPPQRAHGSYSAAQQLVPRLQPYQYFYDVRAIAKAEECNPLRCWIFADSRDLRSWSGEEVGSTMGLCLNRCWIQDEEGKVSLGGHHDTTMKLLRGR